MSSDEPDRELTSDEILRSIAKDLKSVKATVNQNGKILEDLSERIKTVEEQQKTMKDEID